MMLDSFFKIIEAQKNVNGKSVILLFYNSYPYFSEALIFGGLKKIQESLQFWAAYHEVLFFKNSLAFIKCLIC